MRTGRGPQAEREANRQDQALVRESHNSQRSHLHLVPACRVCFKENGPSAGGRDWGRPLGVCLGGDPTRSKRY